MDEHALREMIADVKAGRMTRRSFVRTMVGLGLTAPMAAQMLAAGGRRRPAQGAGVRADAPGGGGPLKTLWWQAPTLLNPHFATGTKDQDGSRIFYEPLAGLRSGRQPLARARRRDPERGERRARPRRHVGRRGNLKKGVTWHDGKPFTADDVVFNWEYAADPATAAVTIGAYREIDRVERLERPRRQGRLQAADRRSGSRPSAARTAALIPKHLFAAYKGDKSREAPANLKPVGTGPYRFVDFKPGDIVRGEHQPRLPRPQPAVLRHHRDEGRRRRRLGGAGRAPDRRVRLRLEHAGRGRHPAPARAGRQGPRRDLAHGQHRAHPVQLHRPGREVDGERSSIKTTHPTLSDPAVRQALEPPRGPGVGARADLRAPGAGHRELPERARRASTRGTRAGSSTSTRPTRSWTRRAGSAAPTACAPRTASGSSSSTRPPPTPRGRRPRPSSSRRRPRRASRSRSSRWWPRSSSPRTRPTPTPTRTSTPISRCTTRP